MHKIRTAHKSKQGRIFSWMVLIMGFGIGLTYPFFPNFIKSIVHTDTAVSIFYATMALIMFFGALASTIVFKKVERTTIAKISLLTSGITFFLLIFVTRLTELAVLNTIKVWFTLLLLMALSLFVRDFAKEEQLGEEEGRFFKFHNIGYFLGPLVGGFLAITFGYEFVFILTSIVLIAGLLYFYHQHIIQKHTAIINRKKITTSSFLRNIKTYFSNKERIKIYLITVVMMIWVGFKTIYIPLYVLMSGYIESMTGLILALSIIPFILLEVKVGEYADKKGIRIPISLGFLILAIGLFIVFLSPYTLLNFVILVLINIGASFVEPLQEYHLFKNLPKEEEEDLFGVYMTADPIAYFITPVIGALILIFSPFNYIFLAFGTIMLLTSLFSWLTMKNS